MAFGKQRNWHHWLEGLRQWLKTMKPPFGVMAAHDIRARMVVDACHQLGLFVPHDVAVIGVDNDRLACEVSRPTLSSVARNGRQIGYRAAQLLDRLLSGRRPPKADVIVPPAGVVARESTDIVRSMIPISVVRCDSSASTSASRLASKTCCGTCPYRGGGWSTAFVNGSDTLRTSISARPGSSARSSLLAEATRLPLEQVARAAGFSGARNFRLVFHRFTGTTPSQYRRLTRATECPGPSVAQLEEPTGPWPCRPMLARG